MSDNGNPYVSSIVCKYGDIDKVSRDAAVVWEILGRQGQSLFIDVLAESVGRAAIKFKMTPIEIERVHKSMIDELHEAILERT